MTELGSKSKDDVEIQVLVAAGSEGTAAPAIAAALSWSLHGTGTHSRLWFLNLRQPSREQL